MFRNSLIPVHVFVLLLSIQLNPELFQLIVEAVSIMFYIVSLSEQKIARDHGVHSQYFITLVQLKGMSAWNKGLRQVP